MPENNLRERLLGAIGVSEPYFALRPVHYEGGHLTAIGEPEIPAGFERGPMTCGDIGRHGAIAGLSALALGHGDGKRRYYLATKGVYRAHHDAPPGPLRFEATVTRRDKRKPGASVEIYRDDLRTGHLDVDYVVFSEGAFKRLFGVSRRAGEGEQMSKEEYEAALRGSLRLDDGYAQCSTEVPTWVGDGHFEGQPMLPVAVTFNQFSNLVGELVGRPFRITSASIEATDFVRTRTEATFRCWQEGERRFRCAVESEGVIKSNSTIEVEPIS